METKLRKQDDVFIIDVQGELDLYNTSQLRELFSKMIEKGVKKVVINLAGVNYIDSSGIGTLINIHSLSQQKSISFCIANVEGTVKKVIELTKLTGFFPLASSLEEAVTKVK